MDKPNKIIKYDNTFNKTSLSLLTKVESDILISVLSKMGSEKNANGCYVARFSFRDLRETSGATNMQHYRIKKVFDTLLETKVEFFNKNSYEKGNLFSHYAISEDNKEAEITLTKNMTDKLIPDAKEFTILNLNEYIALPTNYSKEMYRLLRQFRYSGKKVISKQDFINMLKPPKSYGEYDIVRKVVLPAIAENRVHFEDLSINIKSNGCLPEVIKITFKPHPKNESKLSQEDEDDLLEHIRANSNLSED